VYLGFTMSSERVTPNEGNVLWNTPANKLYANERHVNFLQKTHSHSTLTALKNVRNMV